MDHLVIYYYYYYYSDSMLICMTVKSSVFFQVMFIPLNCCKCQKNGERYKSFFYIKVLKFNSVTTSCLKALFIVRPNRAITPTVSWQALGNSAEEKLLFNKKNLWQNRARVGANICCEQFGESSGFNRAPVTRSQYGRNVLSF